MHKFIVSLTNEDSALITTPKVECFLISTEDKSIAALITAAKKNNKLILIYGLKACEICKQYDADGVLIDLSKSEHCAKEINFARKQIGDKALGIISRNRRHEAMLISECEPDFVVFKAWQQGIEQTRELVSWYNEMFLIQSAVILEEKIPDPQNFDCDIIIMPAQDYKNIQNAL